MKKYLSLAAGAAVVTASLMSAPVAAGVSGNVAIASQYIYRGVVGGDPQVSGGIDWSEGGLYAGTWISSAAGQQEVDFYGGWANDLIDLGYLYYYYPDDLAGTEDIGEIYAKIASGPFSAAAFFAPAGSNNVDDDEYVYVEAALEVAMSDKSSVTFHVGAVEGLGDANKDADALLDYAVTFSFGDLFVSASATDFAQGASEKNEPTFTVGYSWSFDDIM